MIFKSRKKRENKNTSAKLADMYAHRGFHDKPDVPENSMAAFRRAVEHGMPSEIDVHMIADGTLVVFHDDDLEREAGVRGSIESYDLTNLRKLRLEGTDETIPTLDEVLELYEDTGLPLLIELKAAGGNHKEMASAVAARLRVYKGSYVVQSFYPRVLREFHKLMPEVAVGQLAKNYFNRGDGALKIRAAMAGNYLFNRLLKPDFLAYKFKDRKNRPLMKLAEKRGSAKLAWTIRSPEAFARAIEDGCIPIFEGFNPFEVKASEPEDNAKEKPADKSAKTGIETGGPHD